MNLFKIIILVYTLCASFYSYKVISNHNRLNEINSKIESIQKDEIDVIKENIKPEDLIKEFSYYYNTHVDYEFFRKQATLALLIANKININSIKDEYICLALEGLFKALQLEPYNSNLLRSYAFNQRLVLNKKCSYEDFKSDYKQVISFALKKDPQNIKTIRDTGRLELIDGNFNEAARFYKQYQELTAKRNILVDRGIKFLISNNIELSKLLPPVYEHVNYWLNHLSRYNPQYLANNSKSVVELQKKTILNQRSSFDTSVRVIERLLSINLNVTSDEIRRLIDREIVFYLKDYSYELKKYLKTRSNLNYTNNICGVRHGDSRPEYSNLIDWGEAEPVYFDNDFKSIGCYIPTKAKLIELVSLEVENKLKPEDVEVYVSNDNYRWKLVSNIKFKQLKLHNRSILYVNYPETSAKYIKFRFNQLRSQNTFYNNTNKIVNFYS